MDEQMRDKFENWLRRNPDARFWNNSDAMFAAFIGGAALSQPAAQPTLWCLNYLGEPNALYMNREEAEAELARRNKFFPFDAEDRSIVGYAKAAAQVDSSHSAGGECGGVTQWQPIETAPKGCKILIFNPWLGPIRGWWDTDEYAKKPRPYWSNDSEHSYGILTTRANQPTHWMPLPTAPKATP